MGIFLRAVRLLSMVVWVGGLIFFAFVEAPTAFHVMGTTGPFAQLIGESIRNLNRIGHLCGFAFLIATAAIAAKAEPLPRKLLGSQVILVVLMIVATMVVQAHIVPAMERDRAAAGGDINAIPTDNPTRVDFDRLHGLSEKGEGSALIMGVAVVILMAAERPTPTSGQTV